MSEYFANIHWSRAEDELYIDNQYSRGHEWRFDGGVTVPASSSPHIVPLPYSVAANVDPEEAFVASLSSCHMLFFLSIAAKKRYVVDAYVDHAMGVMEKDAEGKIDDSIKTSVQAKIDELKKVKDGTDTEAIKKASEELSTEMQKIGEAMAKAQPQGEQPKEGEQKTEGDANVRDAEFEEKKDDTPPADEPKTE